MAYAVSRHAATKLVIVNAHRGTKKVAGYEVPTVNKGLWLQFTAFGSSPDIEPNRKATPGAPPGFECPDMPAIHGESMARGRLDVAEEALRTGLTKGQVLELLQEHPDNVANGGSEFVLFEDDSKAEPDVFRREDDGSIYCTVCERSFAHGGAAALHAKNNKQHQAKLAEMAA